MADKTKYMITYDVVDGESEQYTAIDEALANIGTVKASLGSSRWLQSNSSASDILDAIVEAVKPKKAKVWVLEATEGAARAFTK